MKLCGIRFTVSAYRAPSGALELGFELGWDYDNGVTAQAYSDTPWGMATQVVRALRREAARLS